MAASFNYSRVLMKYSARSRGKNAGSKQLFHHLLRFVEQSNSGHISKAMGIPIRAAPDAVEYLSAASTLEGRDLRVFPVKPQISDRGL